MAARRGTSAQEVFVITRWSAAPMQQRLDALLNNPEFNPIALRVTELNRGAIAFGTKTALQGGFGINAMALQVAQQRRCIKRLNLECHMVDMAT